MNQGIPASVHYFGNVITDWDSSLGVIVPQTVYIPDGGNQPLAGGAVVSFYPGIPLPRALQLGAGQGFDNRPPTTSLDRARLTLRVLWPGYAPWSTNLNVRERTPTADPVPLHRLIRRIAESVRNFYQERNNAPFNQVAAGDWSLNRIPFERLYLLELRQVSPGSWQPVLSWL